MFSITGALTTIAKIKRTRKMEVELLLARCPVVLAIRQLPEEVGIKMSTVSMARGHHRHSPFQTPRSSEVKTGF
jgi:hypothetical protein